MHTANVIAKEIVELSTIKSAYNHFLASAEAQHDVENTTLIIQNRTIVSKNLKELYVKLAMLAPVLPKPAKTKASVVDYKWTDAEERAILHFNNDSRFTITE
jgi:hypothetical protein